MALLKSSNRRRVLVVDDEPMVTEWLKMVVEQADRSPGYEVRAAAVGSRAIELFRSWRPDVVLLDIVLPDIDGIALLRQLKAIDPVPEMIVISGVGTITRALDVFEKVNKEAADKAKEQLEGVGATVEIK